MQATSPHHQRDLPKTNKAAPPVACPCRGGGGAWPWAGAIGWGAQKGAVQNGGCLWRGGEVAVSPKMQGVGRLKEKDAGPENNNCLPEEGMV